MSMKRETKEFIIKLLFPLVLGFVTGDFVEREHWFNIFDSNTPQVQQTVVGE